MSGAPDTRVRRAAEKQVTERAALDALLDTALVAHVAVVDDGWPLVVPTGFARDGDRLLLHGSTGSRAFRALATGAPTCVTVTVLDGLVLARSQFESSMNYRSAMVLGRCSVLEGDAKEAGLQAISAGLLPGVDWQRPPTRKESAATLLLELPLAEWSLKVSAKVGPDDEPDDVARPVWAGIVPLEHVWGSPVPAPDLPAGVDPTAPPAIGTWPPRA
ncbi:pyridoxamine 5'-phosphate oxidase family protein [Spongisporangium articulatum]|uniref:Pyridoxamine 5'-phosphate oxidase family protein n=1 Tax=Spongisporangium articulatum TaxID=3362603 RepID=A0ABW8AQ04_9ACTN